MNLVTLLIEGVVDSVQQGRTNYNRVPPGNRACTIRNVYNQLKVKTMAINFGDLRASSDQSFAKLQQKIEESKASFTRDERFWSPTVDKEGNGTALIRFLPATAGESIPFVRLFSRNFKMNGRFYHENDRSTIGQKDPVGEVCSALWNSSNDTKDSAHDLARSMSRNTAYIVNVLVIRDPAAPQNEGKVFMYRCGKKIWAKIEGAMNPQFQDQEKFNPFDPWTGANFRIRACKVSGYRNYDQSQFDQPGKLSENDEEIEAIWKKQYPLLPLVAEDQFKSYDELKNILDGVVGNKIDLILNGGAMNHPSVSQPVVNNQTARPQTAPIEDHSKESSEDDIDSFLASLNNN